jgi:hypothetical protein
MVSRKNLTLPRPAVADAFSTAVFRGLAEAKPTPHAQRIRQLLPFVTDPTAQTLAEAFQAGHAELSKRYRNEYVYKNTVISKVIFGRHSPRTASAALELQMGTSVADVVVFNGTTTTYEIKTELDSFARLTNQVKDYSSRTEHVNLVTTESKAAAAEVLLPDHVGIMVLRKSGSLSTVRESTGGLGRLRPLHLFGLLRTSEALTALHNANGYELDVPSGEAWKRARDLYAELPVEVAHRETLCALRRRSGTAIELTSRRGFPPSLRALAYGVELSRIGRERLHRRLNQPLSLVLEG